MKVMKIDRIFCLLKLLTKYIIIMKFIYFGSSTKHPYSTLSNFAKCEFTFNGRRYPSSEHAFQSEYIVHSESRHRFEVDGDLGSLNAFKKYENIFIKKGSKSNVESKLKYWGRKKNGKVEMVGIIAKMAIDPKRAKLLNIKLINEKDRVDQIELFKKLLKAKVEQCKVYRDILISTKDYTLVEFDRFAKNKSLSGNETFWTGMVEGDKIYGKNKQGELQMFIRNLIINDQN